MSLQFSQERDSECVANSTLDEKAPEIKDAQRQKRTQPAVTASSLPPPLSQVPFQHRSSSSQRRESRDHSARASQTEADKEPGVSLERQESARRRRRDSDITERGRQRSGRRQSVSAESNPEEQADYDLRRAERRQARDAARSRDSTRERERGRDQRDRDGEPARDFSYSKTSSLKRSRTESRQNTRPSTRDRDEAPPQASGNSSRPSSRDHAILGTRPTSRDEKGMTANILGARKFFDSWRTKSYSKEQSRAYPPLSGGTSNGGQTAPLPQRRGSLFGRSRKSEDVSRLQRRATDPLLTGTGRERTKENRESDATRDDTAQPAAVAGPGRAKEEVVRKARQSRLRAAREARKAGESGGLAKDDADVMEEKKTDEKKNKREGGGIRAVLRRWFSSGNNNA